TREEFKDFNLPGWGKLAWSISVEPYREGSTISLELRTTATDEESWIKLKKYYRLIGIGSRLIRESLMSHLEVELGKLKREFDERPLCGDEIIPDAKYSITHHIDVEAPRSYVWRYLMQLGCDRAGWYSIDELDNAGTPSVDLLVQGWETRKVGDHLSATPKLDSYFEVYRADFEKCFVLGGKTIRLGDPFKSTWAFNLAPIGFDATELTVRARMESSPRWKEWLLGSIILPPVHSIMQGAQLKNLKRIIERDAHHRLDESVETQLKLSLSK
ncbi:MAG TPA: SRPBCC family protein, partial [Cyclobacteriaceae bacterium]|nr:SRPBCC family protein [Cyclobacteriaceae bacterium]